MFEAMLAPTSILRSTIFSRQLPVSSSAFIRAMHPKSAIRPDRAAIRRILEAGWAGQVKMHGHRAQIHIPAAEGEALLCYNRQGRPHAKSLPPQVAHELRRLFQPDQGWTVVDAEWLKDTDEIFIFDLLKHRGRLLRDLTYLERWQMLPRVFASDTLRVLTLLRTVEACMTELNSTQPRVEGLVFKALTTPGFSDTSIIRCRRQVVMQS